ncbi:hypothetical protein QA640_46410 (plasmid) [Bradyrhizobium sp. CB82]|uniref:hypothetical protein n=1 Tax=Bradyrhizobium sp. CB82 TaxID=3039159 RepID=UPI0024B0D4D6|nr:hypothetical protein [Bradyrhizobium sp. CB82]WFU45451.1 hypothetical protein QA640_46410 [Bradyrhizobium sp. CB82]
MRTFNPLMLLVLLVTQSGATQAADLSGAWASDSTVCDKVFTRENGKLAFKPDADLYAGGVIIQGKQITGRFQKCAVKSSHDDGSILHVTASCRDGVAVSDVTFDLKISGENQIILSSKAPVPMEMPYVRCSL